MELLNGIILVRVSEGETQTEAGLFIPESSVKLSMDGTVEAVAKGVTEVKPGDRVAFLRYAAIDGPEEGTRICKINHLVGVYREENA